MAAQRPAPALIFDGDCGFCTASAQLAQRLIEPRLRIAPWQETDLSTAAQARAQEEVLLLDAAGKRIWGGADAIAVLLLAARSPLWPPFGWLLRSAPVHPLGAAAYRWVSHHRHLMPGTTPACRRDRS